MGTGIDRKLEPGIDRKHSIGKWELGDLGISKRGSGHWRTRELGKRNERTGELEKYNWERGN